MAAVPTGPAIPPAVADSGNGIRIYSALIPTNPSSPDSSSAILRTGSGSPGKVFNHVRRFVSPGVAVKNIVLCFDHAHGQPGTHDATNAAALLRLLAQTDEQLIWYDPGTRARPVRSGLPAVGGADAGESRTAIAEAYGFLMRHWRPGDGIFVLGVGPSGIRARELCRLLATFGVADDRSRHLLDYALATYVLPRTQRTRQDWARVSRLAARLAGRREIGVAVRYLGLWNTTVAAGLSSSHPAEPLRNTRSGRHAVAIDGGVFPTQLVTPADDGLETVWFRGTHRDVTGGPGACWPLADIALDWVLDGAVAAGVILRDGAGECAPAPGEQDALAGTAPAVSRRRLPADAVVHASVEVYLRAHPQYWRRLPARVVWADPDWLARGERLVPMAGQAPHVVRHTGRAALTAAS